MGAVSSPKCVVHVVVCEFGKLLGKFRVVGFFLSVEAQVLEQQSLSLLQFASHFFCFEPNTVGTKAHVFAARQFSIEQHAEAFGHRLQTHFRIRLALGASQMRSQNEPCAVAQCVFNARERLADACVVNYAAVIERDVEIHAHKNVVIAQG